MEAKEKRGCVARSKRHTCEKKKLKKSKRRDGERKKKTCDHFTKTPKREVTHKIEI